MTETDESVKQPKLEYEIVLNTGGGSVVSSRVTEKNAGQVAMAFGMDWPSECVIRWPLIVRKVGARPEIEGQALAAALRKIVEIPDGELIIWVAGKRGALNPETHDQGEGKGTLPTLNGEGVLDEVKKVLEKAEGEDWGWVVRTARAGEVLAK